MSHPRRNRLLSAIVALVSLLFMQLAVAAYACPDLMPAPGAPMLDSAGQPMVDCPEMDRQSPTLCHAHTNKLTPSLDKPDAPSVMPFVAAGFALLLMWPEEKVAMSSPPRVFLHASGTSPPIAIRHCCFRL
ncbi:hypothetical protein [Massilia litorea]|jgi:hypothetical protein|uniref:Copper resistance protein n=1 Tax=Massilia litorea TaxID=2769491 RepID=A0A7L9TY22_9BURK|nr:hypothetical protein [Massilia litorea]QOL47701.1 hypothetical protein LPB04_11690 [Massilia litorea]